MTTLRLALDDYLDLRHSLGFSLRRDAKLLAQFISYLDEQHADTVTTASAVAWASLPADASPGWLGFRMRVVRGFAAYLQTLDPAVEVPPPGLLSGNGRRAVPYLYSDTDIAALFAEAEQLRTPLRTATMHTVISLLAVTGMRIGEVIDLDDTDFDATGGLLVVRHAKFGKSRQIPLHPSAVTALLAYQRLRDQTCPRLVA
ncbi:tyrosine-type recombinase/integrase, partial [Amycolatopsis sp. H20-H5]|uniref:tyrosine-type recombinase/integrase n=1 Tax=Amycolatopsis sp. H20-H5 TaxID=3046309 RepID=UPI002DC04D40